MKEMWQKRRYKTKWRKQEIIHTNKEINTKREEMHQYKREPKKNYNEKEKPRYETSEQTKRQKKRQGEE